MLERSLEAAAQVWVSVLLGTGLILAGTVAGWAVARESALPPVRWITWWVHAVVQPLLRCGSWWRRTALIFVNNGSILAGLVLLGQWPVAPLVGVAALGLSLGIGLRVLSALPSGLVVPPRNSDGGAGRRIRAGVGLNLLEPPAIMLTVGLSLGQRAVSLPSSQAWQTFVLWVVPATLLAAAGEAMWLGACQRTSHSAPAPSDEEHPRQPP